MKKVVFLVCFGLQSLLLTGQNPTDTLSVEKKIVNVDDPSQYITRVELFNEFQNYGDDLQINITTLRTIVKLGKRFTTRLDIPFVHNTFSLNPSLKQTGFGDISFRLLGYNVFESPKSAFTASVEFSLNTAESPLLGTGKNIFIPLLTYTKLFPKEKLLLAFTFQQANSFSGDDDRKKVSFSKFQTILIKYWTKKTWAIVAPEWYVDYANGGTVMNLKGRYVFTPLPRTNAWLQFGSKIYGSSDIRYQWTAEVGYRYFLMKGKKKKLP